jgi:hypothetical protein
VTESVLQRRPYFTSVMVAYIAGLGVAFAANAITHLGQPGAAPSDRWTQIKRLVFVTSCNRRSSY